MEVVVVELCRIRDRIGELLEVDRAEGESDVDREVNEEKSEIEDSDRWVEKQR